MFTLGKDATEAFEDVGHSSDARQLMAEYKIGELCEVNNYKFNTTVISSAYICIVIFFKNIVTQYIDCFLIDCVLV